MNFPDLLLENSVWHFRRDRGNEPFLLAFLIAEPKVAIARSAEQDRCTAVATGGHEPSPLLAGSAIPHLRYRPEQWKD
jgi:hypothetical protein